MRSSTSRHRSLSRPSPRTHAHDPRRAGPLRRCSPLRRPPPQPDPRTPHRPAHAPAHATAPSRRATPPRDRPPILSPAGPPGYSSPAKCLRATYGTLEKSHYVLQNRHFRLSTPIYIGIRRKIQVRYVNSIAASLLRGQRAADVVSGDQSTVGERHDPRAAFAIA